MPRAAEAADFEMLARTRAQPDGKSFCQFFLATAVDKVEFMQELLALDGMLNRIVGYAERRESAKELAGGSSAVLREIFLRGEIARNFFIGKNCGFDSCAGPDTGSIDRPRDALESNPGRERIIPGERQSPDEGSEYPGERGRTNRRWQGGSWY